jgi:protein TonB
MIVCETKREVAALPTPPPLETSTPHDLSAPNTFSSRRSESSRFIPVVTLVIWLGCSVIAVFGLTLPYARAALAKAQPEPIKVEMLNVELSNDPLPDLAPPQVASLATPPPAEAVAQPSLPQAVTVAMPSPAIAFALPVEGATRVVEAEQASYSRAVVNENTATLPPVQQLTFGVGAGKQPAPEYPLAAQDAGQEGTVNVRFVVAANGRVASAEAAAASPWPLLNDSAVRTVRNRWRFPNGATRAYEVAIRFVLPK